MSWRKRLGVSVIFLLGLIACILAAFRCAVTVAHGRSPDSVYTLGPLAFWAMAEMTCGFFIICLPCIPKIVKETGILRHIKEMSKASRRKPYNGSDEVDTNSYIGGNRAGHNKFNENLIQVKPLEVSESTEPCVQILFGLRTPVDILQEGRHPPPLLDQPFFAPFAYLPGEADPSGGTDGQAGVVDIEVNAASLFQQFADPQERARVVFRALAAKLARTISISSIDVEPTKALSGYGLDLLMAVELRNWIVREFEAPVAVFDVLGGVSIAGITEMVVLKSAMTTHDPIDPDESNHILATDRSGLRQQFSSPSRLTASRLAGHFPQSGLLESLRPWTQSDGAGSRGLSPLRFEAGVVYYTTILHNEGEDESGLPLIPDHVPNHVHEQHESP
ncbi:hypothetical protein BJX76DRAFT_362351 [Aspergillus varians]